MALPRVEGGVFQNYSLFEYKKANVFEPSTYIDPSLEIALGHGVLSVLKVPQLLAELNHDFLADTGTIEDQSGRDPNTEYLVAACTLTWGNGGTAKRFAVGNIRYGVGFKLLEANFDAKHGGNFLPPTTSIAGGIVSNPLVHVEYLFPMIPPPEGRYISRVSTYVSPVKTAAHQQALKEATNSFFDALQQAGKLPRQ